MWRGVQRKRKRRRKIDEQTEKAPDVQTDVQITNIATAE